MLWLWVEGFQTTLLLSEGDLIEHELWDLVWEFGGDRQERGLGLESILVGLVPHFNNAAVVQEVAGEGIMLVRISRCSSARCVLPERKWMKRIGHSEEGNCFCLYFSSFFPGHIVYTSDSNLLT